uniref:OmpA family protein n=1 Tax=Candidatus Kentrum sp. UNK TaxID=2126344 RepID=A0A451AJA5_9GAMM|nr:MAG: hypothetical protein BECKUNK1418G_GA0071005_10805 [Candidatus Kentron sp. UNK]
MGLVVIFVGSFHWNKLFDYSLDKFSVSEGVFILTRINVVPVIEPFGITMDQKILKPPSITEWKTVECQDRQTTFRSSFFAALKPDCFRFIHNAVPYDGQYNPGIWPVLIALILAAYRAACSYIHASHLGKSISVALFIIAISPLGVVIQSPLGCTKTSINRPVCPPLPQCEKEETTILTVEWPVYTSKGQKSGKFEITPEIQGELDEHIKEIKRIEKEQCIKSITVSGYTDSVPVAFIGNENSEQCKKPFDEQARDYLDHSDKDTHLPGVCLRDNVHLGYMRAVATLRYIEEKLRKSDYPDLKDVKLRADSYGCLEGVPGKFNDCGLEREPVENGKEDPRDCLECRKVELTIRPVQPKSPGVAQ